jgi:hypothetical protein
MRRLVAKAKQSPQRGLVVRAVKLCCECVEMFGLPQRTSVIRGLKWLLLLILKFFKWDYTIQKGASKYTRLIAKRQKN